jgi:hypothetical protein
MRGQLLLVLADNMDRETSTRGFVALSREFRRQLAAMVRLTGSGLDAVARRRTAV